MKNIHILYKIKPNKLQLQRNGKLYLEGYDYLALKSFQNIYITNEEEIKEGDWGFDGLYIFKCLKPFIANETTSGKNIPCFYIELNGKSEFHETFYIKKIILTTDQELIAEGIQSIDDEFLEWFIKNPNCEEVEVIPLRKSSGYYDEKEVWHWDFLAYKILIPQEELKQLTDLEIAIKLEEIEREEPKQEQKKHLIDIMQEDEKLGLYNEPKQETLEEVALNYSIYNEQSNKAIQEAVKFGAKWQAERMYSEKEAGELVYNIIGEYAKHYNIMIDGTKLNDLFNQFKKQIK